MMESKLQPPTVAFLKNMGQKPKKNLSFCEKLKSRKQYCSLKNFGSFIISTFPIITWLQDYKPRSYLLRDCFAGLTISVLHIPQGMAYGLLASIPPINGLYTSFLAPIIYCFFGTSRHISLGTMAIVALMTGSITERIASSIYLSQLNSSISLNNSKFFNYEEDPTYTDLKVKIVTSVTLFVGSIQFFMGVFRFGILANYMSEPLTKGFTTACAYYVLIAQLKNITGIRTPRRSGILNLIIIHKDLWNFKTSINWRSSLFGLTAIVILYSVKAYLSPYLQKRFWKNIPLPIPIDIIIVILSTVISWAIDLNIDTVGTIPAGLPVPSLPPIEYWPSMVLDCFTLALIAFAIAISMAKIMAERNQYKVDSNKELTAYGILNFVTAFFACEPSSAAFSRTLLMDSLGAASQLSGLISSIVLLIVLVAVGPLFEHLPKCVLGAIIITPLRSMFAQIKDLPMLWKCSGFDFAIWTITFLTTLLLDIQYGLACGIIFSILSIVLRNQRPKIEILGYSPETNSFEDIDKYEGVEEVPGVKIIRPNSFLFYGNFESVIDKINQEITKNPPICDGETLLYKNTCWVILDFSSVAFCDSSGMKAIEGLVKSYTKNPVIFTNCNSQIIKTFRQSPQKCVQEKNMFLNIHGAVSYCVDEKANS